MSKLAFLVAEYPPMIGGIARYTSDVVRFLRRLHPVEVTLVAKTELPPCPEHPCHRRIDPRMLHEQPKQVAEMLVHDGVHGVFANHIDLMGPRTVAAFRRAGLKCGCFFYGADINFQRTIREHLRLYAACVLLHHRVVISHGTQTLFRRRLPGLTTRLLLPGIESHESPVARSGRGDGIIALGRLVRRKGFDTLLDSAALLAAENLRPRITLVGDGPDAGWLRDKADRLGLGGQIRFLTNLDNRAVAYELRQHRVFCLLPRSLSDGDIEGFGIVFLEAAREGLPVVAGNSGGVPDAVADGRNGFLVNPFDPKDAARRLGQLLTDDALWDKQSQESFDWHQRFAWSKRDPAREFAFLGEW